MHTHFFCGIIARDHQLYAAVLNQQGRAILCTQYGFGLFDDDFGEILAHLAEFAHLQGGELHIGLCDQSKWNPIYDPSDPDYKRIHWIEPRDLRSTNLPRDKDNTDSDPYADAKILAVICSLKLTQSIPRSSTQATSKKDEDPFPF